MTFMAAAAAIGAGGSILGGLISARGAKKAAAQQAQAAREQLALQREMFGRQQEFLSPYQQSGLTGQNELMRQLGLGGDPASQGYGSLNRSFGASDFQADPGYQFRMSEGLKALDRQAAARGGLISGSALKAAGRYGQEGASAEYQNAFNRYQAERQARYAPLQNLMGSGAAAAGALSGAAGNFGQMGGQALADVGAANAAGTVGSANAYNAALGGVANTASAYGQNRMISQFLGQNNPQGMQPYEITGAASMPMNRSGGYVGTPMTLNYRGPQYNNLV